MNIAVFQTDQIPKTYLKLSMPLVFSMVVAMVYNLADTYFVAATENTDLVAAVSLVAPVFTLLMGVGNIFGQGGASLISRKLGQSLTGDVKRVSAWCFYVSILIGVLAGVLMFVFRSPVLKLLGASAGTYTYAENYYLWLAIGTPLIICSFIHTNFLRTEGLAKESMVGSIGGCVVNVILDPLFISYLGFGAAGAAIATVLGYVFTDVWCFAVVRRKSAFLSVSPKKLSVTGNEMGQILTVGLASAVTNLMQSLNQVLLNQSFGAYGDDKIAALGVAMKVSSIVLLLIVGFTFGGQPMLGFYYGAGDSKRFQKTLKFSFCFVTALALVATAVVYLVGPRILGLFMQDEAFLTNAVPMLRYQVVTMVFVGAIMLITIIFQSVGAAGPAMVLALSRQGIVFVLVLTITSKIWGYTGILAAQPLADVVTMVLAVLLVKGFKHHHVQNRQVAAQLEK